MNVLYDAALKLLYTQYRWGGDDPINGFDCSGLVLELLLTGGGHPSPGKDFSAAQLFTFFKATNQGSDKQLGALAFYRNTVGIVSHVAMCINGCQMIEAGGGGSTVLTSEEAALKNAYVRIRPIRQNNLCGIYMPHYSTFSP